MWPNNVTADGWSNTTSNIYTYTYDPYKWRNNGSYTYTYDGSTVNFNGRYYKVSPDLISRIISSPTPTPSGYAEIHIDSEQPVERELEPCTEEELEEFLAGE